VIIFTVNNQTYAYILILRYRQHMSRLHVGGDELSKEPRDKTTTIHDGLGWKGVHRMVDERRSWCSKATGKHLDSLAVRRKSVRRELRSRN
jgi:hypothetical protein